MLGTTDYVSPEQALGHPVTGQSDLYSLGIVLYEMLTGEVPFKGENQVAVAMKHVREALPDVQARRPEVSAALAAVVDRATAKDLARRYADDAELIADLEDALAIETARAGRVTGEVTSVLRTLPSARQPPPAAAHAPSRATGDRRCSWRGIAAMVLAFVLSQNTHRGTGTAGVPKVAGLQAVSLKQDAVTTSTRSARPTSASIPNQTGFADDRNPTTLLEHRALPAPARLGASPASASTSTPRRRSRRAALEVQTPDPGWTAQVYAAAKGAAQRHRRLDRSSAPAHTVVESQPALRPQHRRAPFRYYLLWITKLNRGDPGQGLGDRAAQVDGPRSASASGRARATAAPAA